MAGYRNAAESLCATIASAVNLIVQASRVQDGSRRMVSITEITGMEGDVISMQEIFVFDRHGLAEDGKVLGQYVATGIRPHFADRCRMYGAPIPDSYFTPTQTGRRRFSGAGR